MYKFLLLLAFGFSVSAAQGQQVQVQVHYVDKVNRTTSDTVYYDSRRKLTWDDFQGMPDPNHFGGAITASGFAYNADIEWSNDHIIMNMYVYTYFKKSDSWKKPHIMTAYHLEHEQRHFDITYLGTLKFIDKIRKTKFTPQNFKTLPSQIFDECQRENDALQAQYDRETKHSIEKEAQAAWNRKISSLLEAFSSVATSR